MTNPGKSRSSEVLFRYYLVWQLYRKESSKS